MPDLLKLERADGQLQNFRGASFRADCCENPSPSAKLHRPRSLSATNQIGIRARQEHEIDKHRIAKRSDTKVSLWVWDTTTAAGNALLVALVSRNTHSPMRNAPPTSSIMRQGHGSRSILGRNISCTRRYMRMVGLAGICLMIRKWN